MLPFSFHLTPLRLRLRLRFSETVIGIVDEDVLTLSPDFRVRRAAPLSSQRHHRQTSPCSMNTATGVVELVDILPQLIGA